MNRNNFVFNPVNGFEDTSVYTNPENETQTRQQLNSLHKQTRDFINNNIKNAVNSDDIEQMRFNNGVVEFKVGESWSPSINSGHAIKNESEALPQRSVLKFTNTEVVDDPVNGMTIVHGLTGPVGPRGNGVPSGGTTSQVLSKVSSTDFDTAWTTLDVYSKSEVDTLLADYNEFVLAVANWQQDATYTYYQISLTGVTSNSHPIIDVVIDKTQYATAEDVIDAYNLIYCAECTTNKITFYATELPTIAFKVGVRFK